MVNFSCSVQVVENILKCIKKSEIHTSLNIPYAKTQLSVPGFSGSKMICNVFKITSLFISVQLRESHIWKTYDPVAPLNN